MPYIKKSRRKALFGDSVTDFNSQVECAGELNYMVTELIIDYLDLHGLNYQVCNDIIGALDNCKSEFKRRVQDVYEDLKIKENGDVYTKDILKQLKPNKRGK